MRPRVNNSAAVLQRRQAQLRGPATGHPGAPGFPHRNCSKEFDPSDPNSALPSVDLTRMLYSHYFQTPDIPLDGTLTFEVIVFAYSMVAMMLQLLHLYRSVFWLPHSYNNNAVNWYLIEWNLVTFAGIFLGRRIIWIIVKTLISWVTPSQWAQSFIVVARSLTTLTVLVSLFSLIYLTMIKYRILNLLFLLYPVLGYFLVFGFAGEPYLELVPHTSIGRMKVFRDKTGTYRTSFFLPGSLPHPDNIRQECQLLRADFNMRLKQVAFNSICSAYYTTFIPCIFIQSGLHFEATWVGRHVMLVWVGCFSLYVNHCFPGCYIHLMHRCATYLGSWTKIEGRVSAAFYSVWSNAAFWPQGSIVRYGKGDLYKAEGVANAAEPGEHYQAKFYSAFRDVSLFSWILLIAQSGLILAQHLSLTWSSQWFMLISEAILLFANYYAMFKVVRDYLIFMKIHAAEQDLLVEMEGSGK